MARPELSRRLEKVVAYPPLCEISGQQRREFHQALLDAIAFEDLPGKWQAAILQAEQNRPSLRVVTSDWLQPVPPLSTGLRILPLGEAQVATHMETASAHGAAPLLRM